MGLGGKLLNSRELDAYETMWHTQIFTPSWSALEKQVRQTDTQTNVCMRVLSLCFVCL